MKKSIHSNNYRYVVFQDLNNNTNYIIRSTIETNETINIGQQTYPLVKVHISSSSHPFYTGEERVLDIEGRVDKFKAKKAAADKSRENRLKSLANKEKRLKARLQKKQ
jgi:large subunit ribosomal protein L31